MRLAPLVRQSRLIQDRELGLRTDGFGQARSPLQSHGATRSPFHRVAVDSGPLCTAKCFGVATTFVEFGCSPRMVWELHEGTKKTVETVQQAPPDSKWKRYQVERLMARSSPCGARQTRRETENPRRPSESSAERRTLFPPRSAHAIDLPSSPVASWLCLFLRNPVCVKCAGR